MDSQLLNDIITLEADSIIEEHLKHLRENDVENSRNETTSQPVKHPSLAEKMVSQEKKRKSKFKL